MQLHQSIVDYSESAYLAQHFMQCICASCSGKVFEVIFDETEGVAGRQCVVCLNEHWIGDSEDYLEEVESLEPAVCTCDGVQFEVMVGLALYANSDDVRWLYLGCQCTACGLAGVYGDWKNEAPNYRQFLLLV